MLTIWQKNLVGCRKHNDKRFTSLPQNCHIRYGLNPKKGRICVAWVYVAFSVWFVLTGTNGLPQNVLLNFRLEFPKSDITIYLQSGINEIFCQMVITPCFLSSNWVFVCEHPKIDKPMFITEPAVPSLGLKLYPSNMQRMLNKELTRFIQSLSRIRQNRASKRKALLARWPSAQYLFSKYEFMHILTTGSSAYNTWIGLTLTLTLTLTSELPQASVSKRG